MLSKSNNDGPGLQNCEAGQNACIEWKLKSDKTFFSIFFNVPQTWFFTFNEN
jgi:hypothetical protein